MREFILFRWELRQWTVDKRRGKVRSWKTASQKFSYLVRDSIKSKFSFFFLKPPFFLFFLILSLNPYQKKLQISLFSFFVFFKTRFFKKSISNFFFSLIKKKILKFWIFFLWINWSIENIFILKKKLQKKWQNKKKQKNNKKLNKKVSFFFYQKINHNLKKKKTKFGWNDQKNLKRSV